MGLLFVFRKGHRKKGLLVLILFLLTSVYALRMGVEQPLERFRTFDASFEVRARYAQRAYHLFEDFKLTGVGVGNLRYAYPKYQAPEDTKAFIDQAHNDYVQFLAEAGIIGFSILSLGLLYYLVQTGRLWGRRHDPFAVTLGVAPLAVMTAIGIHSYSDFNLHYMTNVLMILAVMAIGYSGVHLERHHAYEKSLLRFRVFPLRIKGLLLLAPLLLVILWAGTGASAHFMAESHSEAAMAKNSKIRVEQSLDQIRQSIEWDPSAAGYWWKLASHLREGRAIKFRTADWSDQEREALQAEILEALADVAGLIAEVVPEADDGGEAVFDRHPERAGAGLSRRRRAPRTPLPPSRSPASRQRSPGGLAHPARHSSARGRRRPVRVMSGHRSPDTRPAREHEKGRGCRGRPGPVLRAGARSAVPHPSRKRQKDSRHRR